MHSITIKKDAFFFITTTEEISQDNFAVGQTFCYSSGHNLQFMEYVVNRYVLQGCRNEKDSGGMGSGAGSLSTKNVGQVG